MMPWAAIGSGKGGGNGGGDGSQPPFQRPVFWASLGPVVAATVAILALFAPWLDHQTKQELVTVSVALGTALAGLGNTFSHKAAVALRQRSAAGIEATQRAVQVVAGAVDGSLSPAERAVVAEATAPTPGAGP